jgi:hypothetical protein
MRLADEGAGFSGDHAAPIIDADGPNLGDAVACVVRGRTHAASSLGPANSGAVVEIVDDVMIEASANRVGRPDPQAFSV